MRKIVDGRQFTIKRFGWSDESETAAKVHSEERLAEALRILASDGDVRRIDHKISYNGSEGIPIREEVISKERDIVISRNSYGALCLNTPDVLFADIDFDSDMSTGIYWLALLCLLAVASMAALLMQSWWMFFAGAFIATIFNSSLAELIRKVLLGLRGGIENVALERIKRVAAEDPDLHIRLYRTPLGFRILLMNDTYSPTSERALEILKKLDSDKVYIQMCKNQNCFRARVSPKPWRIGLDPIKPRPGVWPIKSEHMSGRKRWVQLYDAKAKSYSSCHFIDKFGSDNISHKAELVRKIHDDLAKAEYRNLEMA